MNRLNLILLLGIILVLACLVKSCESHKVTEGLLYATQDTLKITKDKHGVQTASIAVLEGSLNDMADILVAKDSTILRLKETAKEYKRNLVAATAINIVTREKVIDKTVIVKSDTVYINGSKYIYPVYEAKIKRKYSEYSIKSSKDSTQIIAEIQNKLDVNWVYKRDKRFGPKRLVADIVTYNQNTETEETHSFKPTESKASKTWKYIERGLCFVSGIALGKAIFK